MIKLKTRKAALKRFKKKSKLSILCRHAGKSHFLMKKSHQRKRKLNQKIHLKTMNYNCIKLMLPY